MLKRIASYFFMDLDRTIDDPAATAVTRRIEHLEARAEMYRAQAEYWQKSSEERSKLLDSTLETIRGYQEVLDQYKAMGQVDQERISSLQEQIKES